MSDLKSRLLVCADLWMAAHEGAPPSRLGKMIAGDANFLLRIADGGGVNLATLEKAADVFSDPANWPDGGTVPQDVVAFVHRVKGMPIAGARSTGQAGDLSGGAAA